MKANKQKLYETVEFLSTLEPSRSFGNLLSLDKAVDYIKTQFGYLNNIQVSEQVYEVQGAEVRNIKGLYNPGKPKRLVVGAHYDSCYETPGADDNASAVAGLLELARMLDQPPRVSVRLR